MDALVTEGCSGNVFLQTMDSTAEQGLERLLQRTSRSLIQTVFDEFSSFVALLGLDGSDTPVRNRLLLRSVVVYDLLGVHGH